jgi:hypothetical protein
VEAEVGQKTAVNFLSRALLAQTTLLNGEIYRNSKAHSHRFTILLAWLKAFELLNGLHGGIEEGVRTLRHLNICYRADRRDRKT